MLQSRNTIGWLIKIVRIDQSRFCISCPNEISKMFNITLKYFYIFNNTPSASWVVHIRRDFLLLFYCILILLIIYKCIIKMLNIYLLLYILLYYYCLITCYSCWSSLFYITSARQERQVWHKCNTSATHEWDTNNTSATWAARVRHEWKFLILIMTRVKTYFYTPILAIGQLKQYKNSKNSIPRTTF